MKVNKTKLKDCFLIEPDIFKDRRGHFQEMYHEKKYKEILGVKIKFVQDNFSHSKKGVLRGMHFQKNKPQGKLVSVISGCVFDVVVDLRDTSETYKKWQGFELSANNKKQLWVPAGFAHGFLVLSDYADFLYKCSEYYDSNDEYSLLWSDRDIGIDWPIDKPSLSEKDSSAKLFKEFF